MYALTILKDIGASNDQLYTYRIPEELEGVVRVGIRVVVPFGRGNRRLTGLVVGLEDHSDIECKEILEVLDETPVVSDLSLKLARFLSERYLASFQSSCRQVLPPGDFSELKLLYELTEQGLRTYPEEVLTFFEENRTREEILEGLKDWDSGRIHEEVEKGNLLEHYDIRRQSSMKFEEYYRLNPDYEGKLSKRAFRQQKVLDVLEEEGEMEKKSLLMKSGASTQQLNELLKKGAVLYRKKRVLRQVLSQVGNYQKVKLNEDQEKVFETVMKSKGNKFLLQGVTGSGKTEVYLQLVEEVLKEGKEAIILVPEISLTPQTIQRFQGRFGDRIAVLHSRLTPAERFDQWTAIRNKRVSIVVGARSAIFAPFENPGMIIIDECHELSYFSEKNPKYSAIEVAAHLADLTGAKLLLGSATPSVETRYLCEKGEFQLLKLPHRVKGLSLPEVTIVDMTKELKAGNRTMFSRLLYQKMVEALKKREQIILFLNKRGHTSYVFCRNCGYVDKCDACDVAMTYHKSFDRMVCHYCGRTKKKPVKCPDCGSPMIKEFGAGTQKLEEETKRLFPKARVLRMDADTTRTKHAYDEIYRKMADREADILIGTQMLAKGFDFPHVSVVGVVAADLSLHIKDYNASERTFQLLTQVAGRAGRESEGSVVFQTYKPNNFSIRSAKEQDYEMFYELEMSYRKELNHPPFSHILYFVGSGLDRNPVIRKMRKVAELLRESDHLTEVKGPAPAVIERLNNRYRYQVLAKSGSREVLVELARRMEEMFPYQKDFYLNITIDPVHFV